MPHLRVPATDHIDRGRLRVLSDRTIRAIDRALAIGTATVLVYVLTMIGHATWLLFGG